jgi:hypothetical protein
MVELIRRVIPRDIVGGDPDWVSAIKRCSRWEADFLSLFSSRRWMH